MRSLPTFAALSLSSLGLGAALLASGPALAGSGVTITSYGHSALLISGGGARVLVNPFKAVACAAGLWMAVQWMPQPPLAIWPLVMIPLVPILKTHGITAEQAAAIQGALGLALIVGRAFAGFLMDRLFAPYVAAAIIIFPIIGVTLMASGAVGAGR